MTDYTKIKSRYVKNKIKGLKLTQKNENYIIDLMHLEKYLTKGVGNQASAMIMHSLINEYPKEYEAIGKELNPKKISAFLKERKKQEKELKEIGKELREEKKQDKKESEKTWKKAGGK